MVNNNLYVAKVELIHGEVKYGLAYLNLTPMDGKDVITLDQVKRILRDTTPVIVSIEPDKTLEEMTEKYGKIVKQ